MFSFEHFYFCRKFDSQFLEVSNRSILFSVAIRCSNDPPTLLFFLYEKAAPCHHHSPSFLLQCHPSPKGFVFAIFFVGIYNLKATKIHLCASNEKLKNDCFRAEYHTTTRCNELHHHSQHFSVFRSFMDDPYATSSCPVLHDCSGSQYRRMKILHELYGSSIFYLYYYQSIVFLSIATRGPRLTCTTPFGYNR